MGYYALKILVSAGLIVAVSELARRNTFLAALLASLPVISLLSFVWMHLEAVPDEEVAALAGDIFWLVIPSLVLFVVLPVLLRSGFGFWSSLLVSSIMTVATYSGVTFVARTLGSLR